MNILSLFAKSKGRLSLRHNISWSFIGNLFYNGSRFLMLILMAKLIDKESVGLFILATAIINPVMNLTNLQLRPILGTDIKQDYSFGEYFGLRIVMTLLLILVCVLISCFMGKGLEMFLVMLAISAYKGAECIVELTYGLFQQHERLDKMAKSRVIRGTIGILLFWVCLLVSRNLAVSFGIVSILWMVIFLKYEAVLVTHYDKIRPQFNFPRMKSLFILAFPLGVTMLMVGLETSIPRYATEYILGGEELAVFGVLSYFIIVMQMVVTAVGSSAMPRLSHYYQGRNKEAFYVLLAKMCVLALFLGIIGVGVGILFGKVIVRSFFSAEYIDNIDVFIWLLAAGGVSYLSTMVSVALTSARKFKSQVPISIITCIVLVISSYLFITRFGMIGGAYAILLGHAIHGSGALVVLLLSWEKK